MKDLTITVKTLYGFEDILTEELNELGYQEVEKSNRSVQLKGSWKDVYRLNYLCRLAIAVLVEIDRFHIHNENDLYKKANKIEWPSFFDVDKSFSVKGAIFSKIFNHTNYPMLLVKDAIVDKFRDKVGDRPNVELKSPQVAIDVYISDKQVVISLNTSGVPLFQRGYRQQTGEAPMNEVLAAGLLRLSGWDKKSTLVDPMCGSGTIAIEAALWAADIPAMIERHHFAFRNFNSYDADIWAEVRKEGNNRPIDLGFPIIASDIDAGMVRKAQRNARVAPIGKMITFNTSDFHDLEPPEETGTLIMNPPYGERMGDEIIEMYEEIGDTFKQKYAGYNCWVVSSNIDAIKRVGLKPNKKIKVFNGSLECSFRKFEVFKGSLKTDSSNTQENVSKDDDRETKKKEPKEKRIDRYNRLKREKELESKVTEAPEVQEEKREEKREKKEAPKPEEKKEMSRGASKYAQRNLKYTTSGDSDKKEEQESKTSTSSDESTNKQQDDKSSFKEKIEQMKKYRKRD